MILVDANLLLYAVVSNYPEHQKARTWLENRFSGHTKIGLPWQSLTAFMRIATNARVFTSPMSVSDACMQVTEWLALPNVWIPTPSERHSDVFLELVRSANAAAGLISDAHLAALAVEHGLELMSTDGDFARFRPLKWRNPLNE